ncbi:MAG: PQQ-binding-like beta-propeller repeat protein, partial [candidate division Zixibacteria bacterium]|nr:PQQ-binding-like beta-propeller repeat protein [candidate division Zixibacteria bacterium]
AKVCCVPFTGAACDPPDLWTTQSRDFGRTGASNMALDDAWCDLTTSWLYETPANTIQYMSPIVHDGRVYISTSATGGDASTIEVLDLISGAHLYSIDDPDLGNSLFNDPTIFNGILYISGGTNFTITGWDISMTPATKVMSRTFSGAGTTGPLRFANIIVIDIGGTEVLFAGSEIGRVVAIEAATGANYGGWDTNPLTLLSGQLVGGSASDGSSLYYITSLLGLDGDVFSVDAASGTINWRLSEEGGLQGAAFHEGESEDDVSEGFTNISYDAGKLFVGARMTGDFPRDGMYYTLNAATGALINAIATNGFSFSNPIVDVNLVYCQTITQWSPAPYGTAMFAASKNTGGIAWSSVTPYEAAGDGRYLGNGVRSCEPEDGPNPVDIIVNTDEEGAINFWNSLTGEQIFRRRWDFGQDISDGAAVTMATDSEGATHVLVTNGFNNGAVVDLVKGADRPRLQIQDYDPSLPVEFSVDLSVIVTVADAFANTGCADLTFTNVNVSDVSNGSSDPNIVSIDVIRPGLLDRSSDLANQLASSAQFFKGMLRNNIVNDASELSLVSVRELDQNNERFISRSATSSHPFLNAVTQPVSGQALAAGASMDLILDVNPSEILRGPQTFYIELDTDDPDFFVNAGSAFLPSPFPEISVTLVGGCLTDTTFLAFGVGGDDGQTVSNTGRLADTDWSPGGMLYNGEGGYLFLATYVFGVSTERIAMNVRNWFGQPEENSWNSIQGDPNWSDNSCKPALLTGVDFGGMWDEEEEDYQLIEGNVVYKSWIDSVQDYSLGAGLDAWNWRNYGAPFNDSLTMGVSANTRTIGVEGVAEFGNFSLEIFEISNRSATDSIPGWKFGSNIDYDAAQWIFGVGLDSLAYDRDISATWTAAHDGTGDFAFGQVKLPFGCGYEPMVNAVSLDSDQGHFESTAGRGDPYWDSCYFYLSLAPGTEYAHDITNAPQDAQSHSTIIWHDFAPSETIVFGVVNFGLDSGVTDPLSPGGGGEIAALANFANKWAGFGRGDVDNDNNITVADIMTIVGIVSGSVLGAIPFEHLADVNADGLVTEADVNYLVDYYFNNGPCPEGAWTL